jgi:hypothetical protein
MISRSTLIFHGLTPAEIDDLENDPSIRYITDLSDLIRSLYHRVKHSEKNVNELWDKIKYIKNETIVISILSFVLGISITIIAYNV